MTLCGLRLPGPTGRVWAIGLPRPAIVLVLHEIAKSIMDKLEPSLAVLPFVRSRQMEEIGPIDLGDSAIARSVVVALGRSPPEWEDPHDSSRVR